MEMGKGHQEAADQVNEIDFWIVIIRYFLAGLWTRMVEKNNW
jgi:hypothetical protein